MRCRHCQACWLGSLPSTLQGAGASVFVVQNHQDTNTHSCKLDIKFSHLLRMFGIFLWHTQVHLAEFELGPWNPWRSEGRRWSRSSFLWNEDLFLPICVKSSTLTLDRLGTGFKQVKTFTEEVEHCSFWSFEVVRPSIFVQACPLLFAHGIWKVGPMRMCWDCAKVPDQDGLGGNQRTHKKLYVAWHCTMEPENGLEFGGVPKVVTT